MTQSTSEAADAGSEHEAAPALQQRDSFHSEQAAADGDERGAALSLLRSTSHHSGLGSRRASLASFAAILDGTDEAPRATLVRQTLAAGLRGACTGLLLKGGLSLASLATKRKQRHKPAAGAALDDVLSALRYAAFLGVYTSGFRLADSALLSAFGRRSGRWRAALAGMLVAQSYKLASAQPSTSFTIYIALRAALLALRAEAARNRAPLNSPAGRFLMQHGATVTMSATASVLLHAWLLEPRALEPAYVKFLNLHGGKGRAVIDGVSEMARTHDGTASAVVPAVRDWHVANGTSLEALGSVVAGCDDPCELVHPGEGHLSHAARFVVQGIMRAVPVYLPVYAVSTAMVQRSSLMRNPKHVAQRATLGILRSSLFLSSYCAIAWLSCCTVHHVPRKRRVTRGTVLLCSAPAGLAALIEKPSRRTELALFCAGHACHSLARLAVQWGVAAPMRNADLLLLTASSGLIMDAYIHAPHTFRPAFRSVFDWLFGVSWRRKGSIQSLLF
jgi:hypothetical protein